MSIFSNVSEQPDVSPTYLAPDEKRLISRFWQSASGFWRGPHSWRAWLLVALLIATVLLQLLVQYRLNFWNRDFFNAIERKDGAELWAQALRFVAACRCKRHTSNHLGLGSHDHAAQMARVAEQSPVRLLARKRSLPPAQIHIGRPSNS